MGAAADDVASKGEAGEALDGGRDGVEVLVDSISLPFLEGATLDLEASIIKQGFAITSNPNAEKGCGCGSSFAPRMD